MTTAYTMLRTANKHPLKRILKGKTLDPQDGLEALLGFMAELGCTLEDYNRIFRALERSSADRGRVQDASRDAVPSEQGR